MSVNNGLKYVAIGFTIIVLSVSCKKKCKDAEIVSQPINKEAYAYFNVFKKGNYWVYKTSDLLQKDSLFVISSSHVTYRNSTSCTDEENLFFTLKSTSHNLIITDSVCANLVRNELNTANCNSSAFFIGGRFIDFGNEIISDFSEVNRSSGVSLNGTTYTGNIIEIIDSSDDTLVLQENIGIIGWKRNNQTFNLTNYYIH